MEMVWTGHLFASTAVALPADSRPGASYGTREGLWRAVETGRIRGWLLGHRPRWFISAREVPEGAALAMLLGGISLTVFLALLVFLLPVVRALRP
jgi:hypothetical protein